MDISNFIKYSQIIKQGAEAKIYLGKDENDQDVILKERFKKTYRQADLDKSLTKIRTRNEEKLLKKAAVLGI
jgi:tRNA A-37 threonylcarbamoyl transferase component Bud32